MILWQFWVFVFGAAFNTSIANLLIKKSRLVPHSPDIWGLLFSPWFMAGIAFYGISVLLFAKALEGLPVSLAYPAQAGMAFAMLTLFSGVFLHEPLSLLKISGIGVILAGMVMVAR